MNWFDKFADWVADRAASHWFFIFCMGLVLGWLIGLPFRGWNDQLWHLVLNSPTTAITFLMVALLHNTQHRFEKAVNARFSELLDKLPETTDPVDDEGQQP